MAITVLRFMLIGALAMIIAGSFPITPGAGTGGLSAVVRAASVLVSFGGLSTLAWWSRTPFSIVPRLFPISLGVFLFFCFVSAFWSAEVGSTLVRSLESTITFALLALWCAVAQWHFGDTRQIAAMVAWALIGSIAYGLLLNVALVGHPLHFWLNPDVPDRPRLVFGYNHALYTGDVIALAIISIFFTSWPKTICLFMAGLLGYLLLLTDATGARAVLVLCLGVAFISGGRDAGSKFKRALVAAAFVLIAGVLLFLEPGVLDRFSSQRYTSLTGRTAIWAAIIDRGLLETLLGTGFDASRSAIQQAYGIAYHAHNQYLAIVVELGWVGAMLFMLVLISCAYRLMVVRSGLQIAFALYALAISMNNVGLLTKINMMLPFALSFFLIIRAPVQTSRQSMGDRMREHLGAPHNRTSPSATRL